MKAEFTWSANELIEARKLHWRHIVRLPFRIAAGFVVAFSFAAGVAELILHDWIPGIALVIASIYFVFFRSIDKRWAARRHFRSRPDKDAIMTTIFEDDVVQTTSSVGDRGESRWSSFHKAVVGRDGVLLYHNSQIFRWFPKHAFSTPEDFSQFIELVRRKVPKQFNA